jgi:alkylation response protein AidB-like acyl-CoA dehydrogenase
MLCRENTVDLRYATEHVILRESAEKFLAERYDYRTVQKIAASDTGWNREIWGEFAKLGWLGLPFAPEDGGNGGGAVELSILMEAFGKHLVIEPYLATVVLGGGLVAAAGSPEQKQAVLPGVAAGDTLLAFAFAEPGSRWSLTDISATARPAGAGWTISGEKIAVLGGDAADQIVLTARTPDGEVGLFITDAAAGGLTRAAYPMQDGLRGADLLFTDAPAEALGTPADALATIEGVLDVATAGLCAEAVGAMDRMLWLTVDYLKTRVQFGKPISVFQTLQHRAADMYVSLEQARSMALVARLALSSDDVAERRVMVRAAKLQIDLAARHVGQEAVQLHGGIGMTMEYPVGHYLKRTTVIAKTFADVDRLTELVGAAGGLVPAG